MAGTSATVEAVVTRAGVSPSRASKFAKAGMQAGFLPKSGKGGGEKNTAHWFEAPLAFYGVGVVVAEASTEVDSAAQFFLNCEFWKRVREDTIQKDGAAVRIEHPQTAYRGFNALTLGYSVEDHAIERMVNRSKFGDVVQETLRSLALGIVTKEILLKANFRFSFTLSAEYGPHVTVHYEYSNGDSVMDFYYPDKANTASFGNKSQRTLINRSAMIDGNYLAILGDLLRDSIERTGLITPSPDGGLPPSGAKKNGATPKGVTPLETSSADEPSAARRGYATHKSSACSCDPTESVRVCPGNVSGLVADPPSNPVPEDFTHERERIAA